MPPAALLDPSPAPAVPRITARRAPEAASAVPGRAELWLTRPPGLRCFRPARPGGLRSARGHRAAALVWALLPWSQDSFLQTVPGTSPRESRLREACPHVPAETPVSAVWVEDLKVAARQAWRQAPWGPRAETQTDTQAIGPESPRARAAFTWAEEDGDGEQVEEADGPDHAAPGTAAAAGGGGFLLPTLPLRAAGPLPAAAPSQVPALRPLSARSERWGVLCFPGGSPVLFPKYLQGCDVGVGVL